METKNKVSITLSPLITSGRGRSTQQMNLDDDFEEKFVVVAPKDVDQELMISFDSDVVLKKFKNFNYSKDNYSKEKYGF